MPRPSAEHSAAVLGLLAGAGWLHLAPLTQGWTTAHSCHHGDAEEHVTAPSTMSPPLAGVRNGAPALLQRNLGHVWSERRHLHLMALSCEPGQPSWACPFASQLALSGGPAAGLRLGRSESGTLSQAL